MSHTPTPAGTAAAAPATTTTATAITLALIAFALLSVLFLLQENGLLLSSGAASYLHEATHDARHALGVPCH
ncbi:hypothetical protein GCM10023350_21850 [Nocardioides endophyticus]|uniref:CbtB-domain containing protein n=1 Tax=Nocardioides endophyticus TaxID=1353775 RepID=A0ABP8YTE6_9ACTN